MRAWFGTHLPRWASWAFDSALWQLPAQGKREISLTFDDGPTPDATERLLSLLQRHHVQATFFLVGRRAERWPGLVKAIADAGHQIGNHSYFHGDAWSQPTDATLDDFRRGSEVLETVLGHPVAWMRPPYGHFTLPLIKWSRSQPQRLVMWDVVAPDYQPGQTSQTIHHWLNRLTRPQSIVCLHDNAVSAAVTPDVLEEWIPRCQDRGWTFGTLPEFPAATTTQRAA